MRPTERSASAIGAMITRTLGAPMSNSSRAFEYLKVQRQGHTTIHYTVSGPADGPTVVIVHGWACSAKDYEPLTGFLPGGFRVIAVDLAEHGESRSSRDEWTIQEFA